MITEKTLIEHCALTLSSLKTASLFTIKFESEQALKADIVFWNKKFFHSGVKLTLLKIEKNSALVYVYRQDMLAYDIVDTTANNLLSQFGYENLDVDSAIKKLSQRLLEHNEFPHEIGLFLGYPPKDVEGFICNKGRNCNLCKYWKVYANADEALITFAKFDKCKAVYKKLWHEGQDILRLTVKKQAVA